MSNNNSSSNRINVPEAKQIWSAGRAKYERQRRTAAGHVQRVEYIASVTI